MSTASPLPCFDTVWVCEMKRKLKLETMSQELEQQKKENSALESDLGKANDKEFIKGLAKDQLGLAEDGERIFYDVNH